MDDLVRFLIVLGGLAAIGGAAVVIRRMRGKKAKPPSKRETSSVIDTWRPGAGPAAALDLYAEEEKMRAELTALTPVERPDPDNSAPAHLGRWTIKYRDRDGVESHRVVKILAVRPRLQRLECWCELKQETRTFRFDGILFFANTETGEITDFRSWISAYNRSRGNKLG